MPRGADSARAALAIALSAQLRLFAPVLPFVTEEVWSWWKDGSVHRAPWPTVDRARDRADDADQHVLTSRRRVLGEIRKAKSDAKKSMRVDVTPWS